MSTLIAERQWNEIRRLTEEELRQIHGCEVFDGDAYLFTLIKVPTTDYVIADNIRIKAEYLAQLSNSVLPPEKVNKPLYPNLVKAREARRLKRENEVKIK